MYFFKGKTSDRQTRFIIIQQSFSTSSTYAYIMKFYNVLQRETRERERERFENFKTKKIRENKESYKCSFFKHFIVVTVVVLLDAHEQSCLAPCCRVARNQFLFEEAYIKRIYIYTQLVSAEQSLFYSSSLSLVLFFVLSRFLSISKGKLEKEAYNKTP